MTLDLDWAEVAARQFEPVTAPTTANRPRWDSPGQLARVLDPRTRQTPALDLIDEALVQAFQEMDGRLIISMAPQEGKSTRVAKDFPVWALTEDPDLRIVTASYGQRLADRNGRAIRNAINVNADKLGLAIASDNGAVSEWQVSGHEGGVYSVGIGGSLTGRPADLMVIDDPIKDRKEADSKVFRDNVWDWWTDTASTRLAPGAPVVLILTRWHHDDLAGRLLAAEDGHTWRVINIPAQADHDPSKGQTDPLGREPGEYMLSARTYLDKKTGKRTPRTVAQWEAVKVSKGPRTWASLFQGRPSPEAGHLFPKVWARYETPLWVQEDDGRCWVPGQHEIIQSWDFTFKDHKGTDFVVGQVWMREGATAYLLDMVRRRMAYPESREAVLALTAKWPQAVAKLVEDKANGPAIISSLQGTVPGIIPVEPDGSKYARASAISPFAHSGNLVLPTAEILPNVVDLEQEARDFPNGAHDDTIDSMSQATYRLLLQPLLEDDVVDGADLLDEDDPVGYLGGY